MRQLLLIVATLQLVWGAAIIPSCPDSCSCLPNSQESIEISCNSYDFIKKITPKGMLTITTLHLNNSKINEVDPKLNYVKNINQLDLSQNEIVILPAKFPYLPKLEILNISHNHLEDVSFLGFPDHLEVVDLSHNSLTRFPVEWSHLPKLKTLYLQNNPIDCDCRNLLIFDKLSLAGVKILEEPACRYPEELEGRLLKSVADMNNCSIIENNLLDTMIGDEGSGSYDAEYFEGNNLQIISDEDEFINASQIYETKTETLDEGSGDYGGSGDIIPLPIACLENCSTPKPIGSSDEPNASPPPNIKESFKIIWDDFQTAESTTESKVDATTEASKIIEPMKEEEPFVKVNDKNSEVETFPTNDTVLGEMERASLSESGSKSMYIVIGLLLTFLVFIGIYYLNKKMKGSRSSTPRRQKVNENGFGEEMKPLEKTAGKPIRSVLSDNEKMGTAVEQAPLLNGNGKHNADIIPTVHTDQYQTSPDEEDPDVVLRDHPMDEELLTPQLERVTIKSAEIPDSIPKTPIFVTRKMNNDGEYVTTVSGR